MNVHSGDFCNKAKFGIMRNVHAYLHRASLKSASILRVVKSKPKKPKQPIRMK